MDRNDQIKKFRENIPGKYNEAYRKLYDKAMSGKSKAASKTGVKAATRPW